MFKYRLYWADGIEAGEAEYAVNIKVGEMIWANGNQQLRVLDLVPIDDPTSPYVGLLKVESAEPG
jgi:hypothetical protein